MSDSNKQKELILGDEFEKALISGATIKNATISVCKDRNKDNYMGFYDIMLGSRVDIQELLNLKGKKKTEDVKNQIKVFKNDISQTYKGICEILGETNENDEGEAGDEETRTEKSVAKIARVVKMLHYINNPIIENAFKKFGIELKFKTLEDEHEMFTQDHIKDTIRQIFDNGKAIKQEMNEKSEEIKNEIYESSVPIDLQYDKQQNPTGIKKTDFCKLVELKAKMLKAENDEAKEKVKEQAENVASEYVFQNARNEILNKKVIELSV